MHMDILEDKYPLEGSYYRDNIHISIREEKKNILYPGKRTNKISNVERNPHLSRFLNK